MKNLLNRFLQSQNNAPDAPYLLTSLLNLSLRIDAGKLTELSPPFLTQLKGKDLTTDYFTVVRKIGESGIEYYDPEAQRWRTGPVRDFLSRWSGIVLLAEVGEGTDEPDYPEKVKAETRERILQSSMALWFPAVVILAACMAIFSSGRSAVLPFLYAVFTLAGCIVSFFLMWFDYDRYNPLLRQICGGLMIQCVIVLQAGIMYAGRWDARLTLMYVQMAVVPRLMTAFALPFMIVSVLSPLLRGRKEKHHSYLELQRIKHDPQIFRAMLAKQPFLAGAAAITTGATAALVPMAAEVVLSQ